MNGKLQSALTELKKAGASGLPSPSSIEAAENGKDWHGKKKNGSSWRLTKNSETSYSCTC